MSNDCKCPANVQTRSFPGWTTRQRRRKDSHAEM